MSLLTSVVVIFLAGMSSVSTRGLLVFASIGATQVGVGGGGGGGEALDVNPWRPLVAGGTISCRLMVPPRCHPVWSTYYCPKWPISGSR